MIAKTQIGGKYDSADSTIFQLKNQLQDIQVEVTHPKANQIINTINGRGYAFDITKFSFLEIEKDYYRSIDNCNFHTVNNRFLEAKGYLGESASLEIAYAMLKSKPILLMYPLLYTVSVDNNIKNLLDMNRDLYYIYDLTNIDKINAKRLVLSLKEKKITYRLPFDLVKYINNHVQQLFNSIKNDEIFP